MSAALTRLFFEIARGQRGGEDKDDPPWPRRSGAASGEGKEEGKDRILFASLLLGVFLSADLSAVASVGGSSDGGGLGAPACPAIVSTTAEASAKAGALNSSCLMQRKRSLWGLLRPRQRPKKDDINPTKSE